MSEEILFRPSRTRMRSAHGAMVLFEWLARTGAGERSAAFVDWAEQRVLWDLEAALDKNLTEPFKSGREPVTVQVDHVIVRSGGNVLGPDGLPIKGSIKQNPQAHIRLDEWLTWTSWNAP